jgi:protein phosphatase
MGGAAAGEIASEMAVTTLRESLELDPDSEVGERLKKAAEIANQKIWDHAQNNPELTGMGATLTACLVAGSNAYIAQVGDSRAYLLRGDQIKQITKDQSLVQMLIEFGAITPDQANQVPANVIMQALGTQVDVRVSMTAVRLVQDDCLLLCSDGLSNKVTPDELRRVIRETTALEEACHQLVDTANNRGGEDNITVVVARFVGDGLETARQRSITGSLNQLGPDFFAQKMMELSTEPTEPTIPQVAPATAAALSDGQQPPPAEPAPKIPPQGGQEELAESSLSSATDAAQSGARTERSEQTEESVGDGESDGSKPELSVDTRDQDSEWDPDELEASQAPTAPLQSNAPDETDEDAPDRPNIAKKSYLLIWVVAVISLILVAATAYFFYNLYLKPAPPPTNEPVPTITRA